MTKEELKESVELIVDAMWEQGLIDIASQFGTEVETHSGYTILLRVTSPDHEADECFEDEY